jgi:hypothetical protein
MCREESPRRSFERQFFESDLLNPCFPHPGSVRLPESLVRRRRHSTWHRLKSCSFIEHAQPSYNPEHCKFAEMILLSLHRSCTLVD